MPLIRGPRGIRHEVMSRDDKLFPAAFRQVTTRLRPATRKRAEHTDASHLRQAANTPVSAYLGLWRTKIYPPARFDAIPVISSPERRANLANGRLPYRWMRRIPTHDKAAAYLVARAQYLGARRRPCLLRADARLGVRESRAPRCRRVLDRAQGRQAGGRRFRPQRAGLCGHPFTLDDLYGGCRYRPGRAGDCYSQAARSCGLQRTFLALASSPS